MKEEFILVDGEKIDFYLQRKNIKNMNLRVDIDKRVLLSVPKKMPLYKVKEFIENSAEWIRKQQDFYDKFNFKKEGLEFEDGEELYILGDKYELKMKADCKNKIEINEGVLELYIKEKYIENKKYIRGFYEKFLKGFALKAFEELVVKYHEVLSKYNIEIPKVEVRRMKARWGSCMPKQNKVVFNLSLIKTPPECIEYVVLHELSHFRYQNHGKNFYGFIALFMPDWKTRKKVLDEEFSGVI